MQRIAKCKKMLSVLLSCVLMLSCLMTGVPAAAAENGGAEALDSASVVRDGNRWTLENPSLRVVLAFADGSIALESFYNKAAEKEYLTPGADSYLFSYTYGEYIDGTVWTVEDYKKNGSVPSAGENTVTLRSDDGGWTLGKVSVTDITMIPEEGVEEILGKQLEITLANAANAFETRLVFGVYDGEAGFHYQNFVKNTGDKKMVITESDVISLSFPNGPHYLHYVNAKTSSSDGAENATWKTATGGLPENTGRNALCVYTAGDGFWIMPETNWRTQNGPQTAGSKAEGTKSFNEFATTSIAAGGSTELTAAPVKVACVGDSITEGVGSSSGNSYPSQLQKLLGDAFEVKNFGVGGRTLLKNGDHPYWNESAYTQSKAYQPDVVIIMLGTNDSKPQNWAYKDAFKSDYLELIAQYKALESNPKIYIATSPVVISDSLNISASVVKDQIVPLEKEIAAEAGCEVIDIFALSDGQSDWFTSDHVHPNDLGYSNFAACFAEYMNAYDDAAFGGMTVKVSTNPQSLQLTLKPGEEFQYIGVNIALFAGDVVDGKMAAEEHFQKRFKYHDTSTIINSNDWDYIGQRTYEYFENTIVPLASRAGIDMVMIDDLWNVDRDSLTAKSSLRSLSEISDLITSNGMMFGLWYSMNGDDHNNGRDLADPASLAEKIAMVEELATTYNVSHQMIDLTEFWQNMDETEYSSPCDNVYRKNAMVNTALNEVVTRHPGYMVKFTNEIDVYPTQGNRQNGLLHLVNNGWLVHNAGLSGGMAAGSNAFGYLPLSSVYSGGNLDGSMADYYHYMYARNVKLNEDPGTRWTEKGIDLMRTFNDWRNGERVQALTDLVKRPTYLGEGWDSNDADTWISKGVSSGPYSWMQISEDGSRALLLATSYKSAASGFTADTRWFDEHKTYYVADVTLDDTGEFTYAYKGIYDGADLVENGFAVDLTESSSGGKAYWFEAVGDDRMQVVWADEKVETYSSAVNGDTMTLTLTGRAGDTATVIVADSAENTGRVISTAIGEDGRTVLSIPASKLNPPEEIGEKEQLSTRFEMEDLIEQGTAVYDSAKVTMSSSLPDDGGRVGASGGIYRFVEFKEAGSCFSVPVTVPADGTYTMRVAYKSHNNQALSALGANGAVCSDTLDLSSGVTLNKIMVQACEISLKAGENTLDVFCMGKGAANGSGTMTLRIDYVEFEPKVTGDPQTLAAGEIQNVSADGSSNLETADGALRLVAGGAASYMTLPLTAETAGYYDVTLRFATGLSGAAVSIYDGVKALAGADLYSASAGTLDVSLGRLYLDSEEAHSLDVVITGRNTANTAGYIVKLAEVVLTAPIVLTAEPAGAVVEVGEKIDLGAAAKIHNAQPTYSGSDALKYAVRSETAFDVAVMGEDGVLTANTVGSAIIRITHRHDEAYVDFPVTVVEKGCSEAVLAAIESINTIGTVARTEACLARIEAAETAYAALTAADRAKVTCYSVLKVARATYDALATEEEDENPLLTVNYIEDLDYSLNSGSTFKKSTCPSGSHKIQFTEDGEVYAHGFGFEPTDKTPGTLLVPVPEGSDSFYARVGVDYAMSAPSADYDQKNVVTISVDGTEMAKTGAIRKNYQDGAWVDNSYVLEFKIPEGAKWLLISNDSGGSRICDHILFADARFENSAAAKVEALIADITPENVNISKYSTETGEKIRAAEEAYYALDEDDRRYVSGYKNLLSYRVTHASFGLLDDGESGIGANLTADERAAVEAVSALISTIPGENAVSPLTAVRLSEAQTAYAALSDREKDCISDVSVLYLCEDWIAASAGRLTVGDVDRDDRITVSDVVALRQLIVNGGGTDIERYCGDLDQSATLSVSDVVALRQLIVQG
ncbi:MAG: GDSL-type esterase/lipase family protein [Candidatus Howiella sp.]|jgi:lysophospholipase L1-like esterase